MKHNMLVISCITNRAVERLGIDIWKLLDCRWNVCSKIFQSVNSYHCVLNVWILSY